MLCIKVFLYAEIQGGIESSIDHICQPFFAGMIVAILAKSGNLDEVRLLLIAIANGVAIKFNPKLTAYFRQYFVCTRRFFDTERF